MIEEVKVAAVLNADRRLAEIPKLDYAISAKADDGRTCYRYELKVEGVL